MQGRKIKGFIAHVKMLASQGYSEKKIVDALWWALVDNMSIYVDLRQAKAAIAIRDFAVGITIQKEVNRDAIDIVIHNAEGCCSAAYKGTETSYYSIFQMGQMRKLFSDCITPTITEILQEDGKE